jgi:uncharacterized membrane protein
VKALAILLFAVLLGAMGQIALKHGLNRVGIVGSRAVMRGILQVFRNRYILLGVLLYGASSVLWLYSMTRLDISFMYPMTSLSYVATAMFAVILLKERIVPVRWVGLVLIVAGSFLIAGT